MQGAILSGTQIFPESPPESPPPSNDDAPKGLTAAAGHRRVGGGWTPNDDKEPVRAMADSRKSPDLEERGAGDGGDGCGTVGGMPAETGLPDAELHAEGFRKSREAQRGALAEDYVELIADLIESGQEARQVDIAARLGVAQPTVARMLDRLAADGLVYRKPYRSVFLTDAGRRIAEESRVRHQTVEAFLRSLGVSPDTARIDAEGIEHHVSAETLDAFRRALARQS